MHNFHADNYTENRASVAFVQRHMNEAKQLIIFGSSLVKGGAQSAINQAARGQQSRPQIEHTEHFVVIHQKESSPCPVSENSLRRVFQIITRFVATGAEGCLSSTTPLATLQPSSAILTSCAISYLSSLTSLLRNFQDVIKTAKHLAKLFLLVFLFVTLPQ